MHQKSWRQREQEMGQRATCTGVGFQMTSWLRRPLRSHEEILKSQDILSSSVWELFCLSHQWEKSSTCSSGKHVAVLFLSSPCCRRESTFLLLWVWSSDWCCTWVSRWSWGAVDWWRQWGLVFIFPMKPEHCQQIGASGMLVDISTEAESQAEPLGP